MNEEMSDAAAADGGDDGLMFEEGGSRTTTGQTQRASKRPAPSAQLGARKHWNDNSGLFRGASGSKGRGNGNEPAPDNVTYRLVQIATPSSNETQNVLRSPQTLVQPATAHMITTNGQGEFFLAGNQQLVLNSSGALTVGTATLHDANASKLTYVPANAISLAAAGPNAIGQAIQLPMEGGGGPYYIMLPGGTELSPSPVAVSTPPVNPQRIITASRVQRAAFIPLSRLHPTQTTTISSPSSGASKQLDFHSSGESSCGPNKEVKRRVSHNEVEKRRRDKINQWITKLAGVVPNCSNEYSAAKLSQSKGGVLAKTVDYIEELRETNEQLIEAFRHYEAMSGCLKEENKQLRDLLKQAGIEAPPAADMEFPAVADMLASVGCSANQQQEQQQHSSSSPAPTASPPASVGASASAEPTTSSGMAVHDAVEDGAEVAPGNGGGGLPPGATVVSLSNQYVVVQTDKGLSLLRTGAAPAQLEDHDHTSGDVHPGAGDAAPDFDQHLAQA